MAKLDVNHRQKSSIILNSKLGYIFRCFDFMGKMSIAIGIFFQPEKSSDEWAPSGH